MEEEVPARRGTCSQHGHTPSVGFPSHHGRCTGSPGVHHILKTCERPSLISVIIKAVVIPPDLSFLRQHPVLVSTLPVGSVRSMLSDLKLSTVNCQLSSVSFHLSAVDCLLSTVSRQLSTFSFQMSTVISHL